MVLKTQEFKRVCQDISQVVDTKDNSGLSDLLELKTNENILFLNVTNKEYYVSVKFPLEKQEDFKATVNAALFLKLITQLTTEEIELLPKDNYIEVRSNGNYKIPYVYSNEAMMELPKIEIYNPTVEMDIDEEILESIEKYNSKELSKGTISGGLRGAVQRLHYIDDKGAITFTTGICVNNFSLEKPIRILLNNKLVKLFDLFSEDSSVHFTLGYDALGEDIIQTKIFIEGAKASLTAILNCDDSLLNAVPVGQSRQRASMIYPYYVDINKNDILQAINRVLLFIDSTEIKQIASFTFNGDTLTIADINGESVEKVKCNNFKGEEYKMYLDLNDLKITLGTCLGQFINIGFGDHTAVVVNRLNIVNVLPEFAVEED